MALELFNTLSAKVEEFHPLEDNLVRMYACGPTVYDYGHIGNFRTFIVVDTLRRFLKQSGYQLKHVMNITDVDDRIILNAARDGVSVQEYTRKYRQAFVEDADALNIQHPEMLVNATDHIAEMARFIAVLAEKGFAYRTEDGSYYFRIAKFPEYGKLSKKDFAGMTDGARVDVDNYDKDNARDFALWKAPKPGEAFWETEIGPGRPGWHIECSTMAMKYLGESFDIHCGGEDLIFPHHENEIAQSEALSGKPFVRVWVHSRFLLVEGEKMAKSAGNFFTVRDLVLMGHKPSSIRFLLMSVPYRKQLNFTFDGLTQAANSVERLRNFRLRLETSQFPEDDNEAVAAIAKKTSEEMTAGLNDDLNTARALGAVFDMVRDVNAAADAGEVRRGDVPALLKVLERFEEIFAVLKDGDAAKVRATVEWAKKEGLAEKISPATAELAKGAALSDEQVERLVGEHVQARKARDFARSDAIRAQLAENGIILENTRDGVRWKRK
ncbi:MAG TPA: cysteine--tRNA ligase [Candidatus Binatia bacterium]|nr:cysteine--tRNA ligase [Candidatus Binatia bacterium]